MHRKLTNPRADQPTFPEQKETFERASNLTSNQDDPPSYKNLQRYARGSTPSKFIDAYKDGRKRPNM